MDYIDVLFEEKIIVGISYNPKSHLLHKLSLTDIIKILTPGNDNHPVVIVIFHFQ